MFAHLVINTTTHLKNSTQQVTEYCFSLANGKINYCHINTPVQWNVLSPTPSGVVNVQKQNC